MFLCIMNVAMSAENKDRIIFYASFVCCSQNIKLYIEKKYIYFHLQVDLYTNIKGKFFYLLCILRLLKCFNNPNTIQHFRLCVGNRLLSHQFPLSLSLLFSRNLMMET